MKSAKITTAHLIPVSFLLVLLMDGFLWFKSSWGKLTGDVFVSGLGETLTKFASKNPYPWFKDMLETMAIPNSYAVGTLVMYGEFFCSVAMLLSVLALIGGVRDRWAMWLLTIGLWGTSVLNLMFWLAAGWTSPSTESLNLLMLGVQVIGLWLVYKATMAKN